MSAELFENERQMSYNCDIMKIFVAYSFKSKDKADIMMREAQAKQAEAVQMASQNAGL